MMDAIYLRTILLYAPRRGVFYWIQPPAGHAELLGEEAGTLQTNPSGKHYHLIQIGGIKYRRSRLAYLYMTGRDPEDMIDHANGDSTDDRWVNLRPANATQNAQNIKNPRKRDLPMGVRRNKSGRYSARITVCGEQKQVGTFDTPEEAAAAYDIARIQYMGEFA